jgi:hypothetical protein
MVPGLPNLAITQSPHPNRSKGQPCVVSATGLSMKPGAMRAILPCELRRLSTPSGEDPRPEHSAREQGRSAKEARPSLPAGIHRTSVALIEWPLFSMKMPHSFFGPNCAVAFWSENIDCREVTTSLG